MGTIFFIDRFYRLTPEKAVLLSPAALPVLGAF